MVFLLYHQHPEMITICYRNICVKRRFYFQGSGYTDSSNALYKKEMLDTKIRLSNIPHVLKMKTLETLETRKVVSLLKVSFLRKRIMRTNVRIPLKIIDGFLDTYISYSIHKFLDETVPKSTYYVVVSSKIDCHQNMTCSHGFVNIEANQLTSTSIVTVYTVSQQFNAPTEEEANPCQHIVLIAKRTPSKSTGSCFCNHPMNHGLPCVYMARVTMVYPDLKIPNTRVKSFTRNRIQIECMWHSYWNKELSGVHHSSVCNLRSAFGFNIQQQCHEPASAMNR